MKERFVRLMLEFQDAYAEMSGKRFYIAAISKSRWLAGLENDSRKWEQHIADVEVFGEVTKLRYVLVFHAVATVHDEWQGCLEEFVPLATRAGASLSRDLCGQMTGAVIEGASPLEKWMGFFWLQTKDTSLCDWHAASGPSHWAREAFSQLHPKPTDPALMSDWIEKAGEYEEFSAWTWQSPFEASIAAIESLKLHTDQPLLPVVANAKLASTRRNRTPEEWENLYAEWEVACEDHPGLTAAKFGGSKGIHRTTIERAFARIVEERAEQAKLAREKNEERRRNDAR